MVLFLSTKQDELMKLEDIDRKIGESQKKISAPAYQACKKAINDFSKQVKACKPQDALALKEKINSYFASLKENDPLLYSENFSLAHRSLISNLIKKQTGEDIIID